MPMTKGVSYAVLLLLHLQNSAILEGPLDNVGLLVRSLDILALRDGGPELGEVLKLDVVPDVGEGSLDDGGLNDGGAGWNRHVGGLISWYRWGLDVESQVGVWSGREERFCSRRRSSRAVPCSCC